MQRQGPAVRTPRPPERVLFDCLPARSRVCNPETHQKYRDLVGGRASDDQKGCRGRLQSVRGNLTANFVRAVEVIASSKAHVYVTGLGKSGIIATKIAATLRSTGTPATFLHPSEALHGDVGVVGKDDVILSIGKSGETSELISLLRVLKKSGHARMQ